LPWSTWAMMAMLRSFMSGLYWRRTIGRGRSARARSS
jgi:hypothetical protein